MISSKKIALLYCGGFGRHVPSQKDFLRWARSMWELDVMGRPTPIYISGAVHPAPIPFWQRIGRRLLKEWNKFEGFVVVVDRKQFFDIPAYVSYALGPVNKPVIFVCREEKTPIPTLERIDTIDFAGQIVFGIRAASSDLQGCYLSYGSKIAYAHEAVGDSVKPDRLISREFNHVDSAADAYNAALDFGMRIHKQYEADKIPPLPILLDDIEDAVEFVLKEDLHSKQVDALEGIVALGRIAKKDVEHITGKPVVWLVNGHAQLWWNGTHTTLPMMSPFSALAKLRWTLGQLKGAHKRDEEIPDLLQLMQDDRVGEWLDVQVDSDLKRKQS